MTSEEVRDVEEYVQQNAELLARLLAQGNEEAQGYALALLVNGGTIDDIEAVQDRLEELKQEVES